MEKSFSTNGFCILGYVPDIEKYCKTHDFYECYESGEYDQYDFLEELKEHLEEEEMYSDLLTVNGCPYYGVDTTIGFSHENLNLDIPLKEQKKIIAKEISEVLCYDVSEDEITWQSACWLEGY